MSVEDFTVNNMREYIDKIRFEVTQAHCDDDLVDFEVHCSPQSGFVMFESMIADIEMPHKFDFETVELDFSKVKSGVRAGANPTEFFTTLTNWYQKEHNLPSVSSESEQPVVNMKKAVEAKLLDSYIEFAHPFEIEVYWPEYEMVDAGGSLKPVFTPMVQVDSSSCQVWLDTEVISQGAEKHLALDSDGNAVGLIDEENSQLAELVDYQLRKDFRYNTLGEEDFKLAVQDYITSVIRPLIVEKLQESQEKFRVEKADEYGVVHKSFSFEKEEEKPQKSSKHRKSSSLGFN
ncbi:hypothetical protein [Salinicola rhizosphaerae]|uniref:Uncharacterized protein n=1 Tax=Salinicola rhizosphaerae TaxID=1443141 RepID=A0ABQ3DSL5_9GAMM|nr:hypothetical protein [Salinicola rhizosphaerae]GHB13011.1 hypothetical protein GCM10009038_08840 [Salinicola rhizosphaerae]